MSLISGIEVLNRKTEAFRKSKELLEAVRITDSKCFTINVSSFSLIPKGMQEHTNNLVYANDDMKSAIGSVIKDNAEKILSMAVDRMKKDLDKLAKETKNDLEEYSNKISNEIIGKF